MNAFSTETYTTSDNTDIPPGYSVRVDFCADDIRQGYPWDEYGGHGIIQNVRSHYGRPDKSPGERPMHSDRGEYWFYDVQASTAKAREEQWGLCPEEMATLTRTLGHAPSPGQVTARAVERDFEYCQKWLTGGFTWCGIVATVIGPDGQEVDFDSLWGVEWDDYGSNDYAKTFGLECMSNALHAAGLTRAQRGKAWRAALCEARARREWAARDVVTVGA